MYLQGAFSAVAAPFPPTRLMMVQMEEIMAYKEFNAMYNINK